MQNLLRVMPPFIEWRLKRLTQRLYVACQAMARPVVEIAGVRIPVHKYLSDNMKEALFRGYYEAAEIEMVRSKLESCDRVMEIGAGIGLISSFCAVKIGSDRVFAFEANPNLESYIKEVYQLNGVSPELQMCLLGASPGERPFFIEEDFWSSSTLSLSKNNKQVMVPVKALNDEICHINPTFLIVDIEGGERELFENIALSSVRKIALELHTKILGKEIADSIKSKLYKYGFVEDKNISRKVENYKEEMYLYRI